MHLAVDRLPKTVLRIAEVVGSLEAALALVLHYGGQSIWPARHGAQRAHLAELMGEAAADRFVSHYREAVTIPLCRAAARAVAQNALRAEFDRLTREGGLSARAAVNRLAGRPPLFHSDRYIWTLLGQVDTASEVVRVGQGELF